MNKSRIVLFLFIFLFFFQERIFSSFCVTNKLNIKLSIDIETAIASFLLGKKHAREGKKKKSIFYYQELVKEYSSFQKRRNSYSRSFWKNQEFLEGVERGLFLGRFFSRNKIYSLGRIVGFMESFSRWEKKMFFTFPDNQRKLSLHGLPRFISGMKTFYSFYTIGYTQEKFLNKFDEYLEKRILLKKNNSSIFKQGLWQGLLNSFANNKYYREGIRQGEYNFFSLINNLIDPIILNCLPFLD